MQKCHMQIHWHFANKGNWLKKKEKGKNAGFQLGKEKSLWLKKLFNVPGKNRVSMNVILGCKGLKDRSPQSDVFYVEISDFIDIFLCTHANIMDIQSSLCII